MGTVFIVEDKIDNEISSVNVPTAGKHPLKSRTGNNEPDQGRAAPIAGHEEPRHVEQPTAKQVSSGESVPALGHKLGQLWDRYGKKLVLLARQWCHTPDDVVQETFCKLAQLSSWPADPEAWLFIAVRNAAINAGDSEQVRTKNETSAARVRQPWFEEDNTTQLGNDELIDALDSLDRTSREIVALKLWSEFTFQEIGEITGQSASTVQRHYAAAIAELQKKIGREGTEDRG